MSGTESFDALFRRLFDERFPSLFRYLHRLTGDADLSEDIAQEVFVKLYQRGTMPDDSRGWMAAVANNLLRDDRRTSKRRLRLLAAQPEEMTTGSAPRAADEGVLSDERRDTVRAALDQLPKRDRQMLLLRHEGYSYREIAQAMGITETSVGTMLLRATSAFQDAITGTGL
ncbi:MAG: sigma-70 family RNA polymerase sigma factor [Gemmatimonadota bacterium]|nr:sigma-70 family RNA polymerase sigma factor [Gemmatimonadota bacterium]